MISEEILNKLNSRVDPELDAQITAYEKDPSKSIPASPSWQNNWNDKSPLDLLREERARQLSGYDWREDKAPELKDPGSVVPTDFKKRPGKDDIPDSILAQLNMKSDESIPYDALNAPMEEDIPFDALNAPIEAPSIGTRLLQGPLDTVGNVAETAMGIAALPLDLVKRGALAVGAKDFAHTVEQGQDWMLKQGTDTGEIMRTALMTPEERATGSTAEKVMQNVAGLLPVLPLGLAAAAPMGAAGTYMTGKAFVDAGEGVGSAMAAGGVQGAANAAGIFIPGFGRTVGHTAALILAGGPVLGAGADLLTQQLTDNKKLQESFDPLDPVARITDTVTSGVFGGIAHYKGKTERLMMQLEHYAKTDPDKFQKTIEEFSGNFSQLLRYNDVPSWRMATESWQDAYNRLEQTFLDETAAGSNALARMNNLNAAEAATTLPSAAQALEILVHVAETPQQVAQARYLLNIAADMGLNLSQVMFYEDPFFFSGLPRAPGWQIPGMDLVGIEKDQMTGMQPQDMKALILHEITHSVTSNLLNFVRGAMDQQALDATKLTPFQRDLLKAGAGDQYKKAEEFIDFLRKKVGYDPNDPATTKDWYGLENIKEMFSELFSHTVKGSPFQDEAFVEKLRKIELTPEEMRKFNHQLDLATVGQFHELARALRGDGQGSIPHTALDVVINHFFGMMEHNNASIRTQASDLGRTPRDAAVELKKDFMTEMKNIVMALRNEPYKKFLFRQLVNAAHNSPTFDNFLVKASLINGSPEWKNFLSQHGAAVFARAGMLRKALVAAGGYKNISEAMRGFVYEDRTTWEFFRDEFDKIRDSRGALTDDLTISAIGSYFFNPSTLRLLGKSGFANRVKKFILDKGDQWAAAGNRLYNEQMNPVKKAWGDLKNKTEKAVLLDAMEHWNNLAGQDELTRLGLMYATPDMMRQKFNLNDRQLAAYKALTDMFNSMYDLANQVHRVSPGWNGKDLERKPGYMPNFHDGVYKVFVNERKNGEWRTVHVKGFNNARAAKHYAAEWSKRQGYEVQEFGRGTSKTPYKVSRFDEISNPFMVAIRENLGVYFNQDMLDQIGVEKIQRAANEIEAGMPKHLMERDDISGFLGEKGTNVWDPAARGDHSVTALLKWHILGRADVFKIFDRYAQGITEAWKNAMFLNDEWRPLMTADAGYMNGRLSRGNFLGDFPKLHSYLSKYSLNFIGQDVNHFRAFDNMLGDFFQKMGLNPYTYRTASKSIRNMLAAIKLRVNPANWVNNAIQPVHALMWLDYINSRTGFKQSPLKALNKLMAHDFKPDEGLQAALQRFREEHANDPSLQMEIAETEFRGPFKSIASDIEETGRTLSFMLGFLHARDMHQGNEVLAYDTAKMVMKQVMVEYDQHSRPLMYQNFGVLGTLAAPFAVFRNAYIGNLWLMLKNIKENPAELHRWTPLITSQLVYLGAAGSLGMIGTGEWNTIADVVNEMMSEDVLPRAEDVFYEAGLPDWFIYGPMSTVGTKALGLKDGAYIGPSGSAISIDDVASLPVKPFMQAITGLGKLMAKAGYAMIDSQAAPPSLNDLYPLTRQFMPPPLQGAHDWLYQSPGSDVAFTSSGLEGSYRRDQDDQLAIGLTGKQSIKETEARVKERSIKRRDAFVTKQITGLVQAAADRAEGKPGLRSSDQLFTAAAKLGVMEDEFAKRVVKEMEDRRLTKLEKDSAGTETTSGARKWAIRERLGR